MDTRFCIYLFIATEKEQNIVKCTMFYGSTECPIVEFIVKRKSLGNGNNILNSRILG